MASVVITLKIMPEGIDVDLDSLQVEALKKIKSFVGDRETKVEKKPIAFGLNCLNIFFVMDEAKGSTEKLEEEIKTIPGVNSVEVTDVRRAIG